MGKFNTGFTETSYFNMVKKIVEEVYGRSFDLEKLRFYFEEKPSVNAHAWYDSENDHDYLTIHTGTVAKLAALIKTAFANRDILPEFGNAKVEQNSLFIGEYICENNDHKIVLRAQHDIVDPVRARLSDYVLLLAARFMFAHEMGHIVNGHTRFIGDMYASPEISMRDNKSNGDPQYVLDMRTLEMDADGAAATNSMDNLLKAFDENKDYLQTMKITKIEDLFLLWGFAVACVFLLFESTGKSTYSKAGTYLPNDARYLSVTDAAHGMLRSCIKNKVISYYIDEQKYDSMIYKGLLEAEKLFTLYYPDVSITKSLIANQLNCIVFLDEVNDNWDNNIRPRLEKYKHKGIVLYSEKETDKAIRNMKKKEDIRKFLRKIWPFGKGGMK